MTTVTDASEHKELVTACLMADHSARERFYAFERAARAVFEGDEPPPNLPLEACSLLIEAAIVTVSPSSVPTWIVRDRHWDGTEATGSCTLTPTGTFVVGLPPLRRRPWTVMHEVAHMLTWEDGPLGHGPTFASACINLWVRLCGWEPARLRALAVEHGVIRGGTHDSRTT